MWGLFLFLALGPVLAFFGYCLIKDRQRTKELQEIVQHSRLSF